MIAAILSDIHSNIQALEAVLQDANRRAPSEYWLLGDIVDYSANPNEVIDRLKQLPITHMVGGNHDAALFLDVHCSGTHEGTQSYLYTKSVLTKANASWLKNLCIRKTEVISEHSLTLLHGTPKDPYWGYLFPEDESDLMSALEHIETRNLCVGHTHQQFEKKITLGRTILNPGSVGQPRNGDPRAQYAIFDGNGFTLCRTPYDIEGTASAIRAAGLPRSLASRLYVGL